MDASPLCSGVALSGHFARVSAVDDRERPFDLYVTHRHAHFPMLSIRRAKVEDTDDLMPVLLQHSTNINQDYGMHTVSTTGDQVFTYTLVNFLLGDYFLSELIASQDDQHKTIVAEVLNVSCLFRRYDHYCCLSLYRLTAVLWGL